MSTPAMLDVSLIGSVQDTAVQSARLAWPDDFRTFIATTDKDVALWNAAAFGPASQDIYKKRPGQGQVLVCRAGDTGRYDECVVSLAALVLDYDGKHGAYTLDDIRARWSGYDAVIHSTYQHTPEAPRYRVILPLSRPVTPAEYERLYTWAISRDGRVDPSCRNPSRFFYWPSVPEEKKGLDGYEVFEYVHGKPLDPGSIPGLTAGAPAHTPRLLSPGSSGGPLRNQRAPATDSGIDVKAVTSGAAVPGTSSREGSGPAQQGATGHAAASRAEGSPVGQRSNASLGGSTPPPSPFAGIAHATAPRQDEDFGLIYQRCRFVQHTVDDAVGLPEPEWRAVLSIAARCEHGEAIAHAISEPDPRYDEATTQVMYERVRDEGGPFTCATIQRDAGTSWCQGCPHAGKVTSPITLGVKPVAPDAPATPRAVALAAQAAATDDTSRLDYAVEQATHAVEQARAAEGPAIAKRDAARRKYALVARAASGASEEDAERALVEKLEAEHAAREATSARRRAEAGLERLRASTAATGLPPGADPEVWPRLSLIMPGGTVKPADTIGNVLRIFREDRRWSDRLTYNTFTQMVCFDGQPFEVEKTTELAAQLAYDYALDTTSARVKECMATAAREREFHPIHAWLSDLRWDGVSRLDDMLFVGFGVEPMGEYEDVQRLLSRRFMLSLVARAMKPGCQVDTMLVLYGDQGLGKSRGLEALVTTDWFSRTDLTVGDKDAYMQLRGNWLYEIGEMHAIRRSDAKAVKSWLSGSVDNYRAPYAATVQKHPRQTVFVGTTNEEHYLVDDTGNRRYWPATVARPVDIDWIEAHRDALFAEAYARYMSEADLGRKRSHATRWWFHPDDEEWGMLAALTARHESADPWWGPLYKWVVNHCKRANPTPMTADEIYAEVFLRQPGDATQSDITRIGRIFSKMEISRDRKALANQKLTYYIFDEKTKEKMGVPVLVGGSAAAAPATQERKASPFAGR